jgi:hypothetical protein
MVSLVSSPSTLVEIFRDFKAMNGVVALCHGTIVSLIDLGECPYDQTLKSMKSKKWVHYSFPNEDKLSNNDSYIFGRQEHEVDEIFLMGINPKASLTFLVLPFSRRKAKKIVYSPNIGKLKPIHNNFQIPPGFKIMRV